MKLLSAVILTLAAFVKAKDEEQAARKRRTLRGKNQREINKEYLNLQRRPGGGGGGVVGGGGGGRPGGGGGGGGGGRPGGGGNGGAGMVPTVGNVLP